MNNDDDKFHKDVIEEIYSWGTKAIERIKKEEEEREILLQKYKQEAGKWIKVGVIGVDAGLCWIGDPCYFLHDDNSKDKDLGESWSSSTGFCKILEQKQKESGQPAAQFNYDLGHPGLGICVNTGYGDGTYDVFIKKNEEGRVMEAKVIFIDENEKEENY